LSDDLPLVPITIEVVVSGIDIVEAPSAQNNWDRLVLRNASKNEINSITVRWKITR